MPHDIPEWAWSMPLTGGPTRLGRPRSVPVKTILMMLPKLARILAWSRRAGKEGEAPKGVKMLHPFDDGANQGVPIGGLGSGSIGRGYLGDFGRWHLNIGEHLYCPSVPDQFHIRIESGSDRFVQTLNPRSKPQDRLSQWAWGMDPNRATYYALFPRAWTTYDFSDHGVKASSEQMSPVIAHNYKESSYPVGLFDWRIANVSDKEVKVSLMFTWENSITPMRQPAKGDFSRSEKDSSKRMFIELGHRRTDEVYPVSYGLGVEGDKETMLSYQESFSTDGHGGDVWHDFEREGTVKGQTPRETSQSGRLGAALCATREIAPREESEITFALSWDIPIMRFGQGREWYRRYTRFFDTSGDNAIAIAREGLSRRLEWDRSIVEWQKPFLTSDRPEWFKSALFNELYYLVDGCTAWETGDAEIGLAKEGMGHFAYLECIDYPFYNTYDVHFYASFALAMNWPDIDNSIQRDFADAVLQEDNRLRTLLLGGGRTPRKPIGVVPHDLGMPMEDPWVAINAYSFQDVGRWKDLNTKLILQVYRNYVFTRDEVFLSYCWPGVVKAMEHIDQFDKDGDGLPENEGFPDQTYDVWIMKGPSAYCGGLYLAAAEAMVAMAKVLGQKEIEDKYSAIVEKGKVAFDKALWTGEYFRYDGSGGKHSDSIMADQLAGLWFTHVCRLPRIVDTEKARRALQTVFKFNVLKYADGNAGAMNGMRPDGSIDKTSLQSAEVWAGTTYGLAALMIHEGLVEEALKTARGVYLMTYKDRGYWFRTPEAWTADGNYRASTYMRPLAIWAIEYAFKDLERKHPIEPRVTD